MRLQFDENQRVLPGNKWWCIDINTVDNTAAVRVGGLRFALSLAVNLTAYGDYDTLQFLVGWWCCSPLEPLSRVNLHTEEYYKNKHCHHLKWQED